MARLRPPVIRVPPAPGPELAVCTPHPWSATTHNRYQRYQKTPNIHRPTFSRRKTHRFREDLTIHAPFGTRAHRALHRCAGRSDRWARRQMDLPSRNRGGPADGGVRARRTGADFGLEGPVHLCLTPVLGHTDIPGDTLPALTSDTGREKSIIHISQPHAPCALLPLLPFLNSKRHATHDTPSKPRFDNSTRHHHSSDEVKDNDNPPIYTTRARSACPSQLVHMCHSQSAPSDKVSIFVLSFERKVRRARAWR